MKIKCIVIDDELPAIEQMTEYIQRIPFLDCIGTFDNAIEPVLFLKSNQVDLIFLDIEMEGLTGIQFLKAVHINSKIILTTAYDSYAIEAFSLHVTDYLLKPISFERFFKAIENIYNQFKGQDISQGTLIKSPSRSYFFVKTEFRMHRIDFDDILYIKGMKEYLAIHMRKERIIVLQNFATILSELPSDNFFRVHKSYIVAVNKIDHLEKGRIFIDKQSIPVGETYRDAFLLFLAGKRSD